MRPAVLVVEDDSPTRTLLTVLIQRCGFDVDVVSHGEDAITLLSTVPYSALVTDLYLPGKAGAEILTFVQEKLPDLLNSSIVLSAAPPAEIKATREQFGISVFRKPFDVEDVSAAILAVARPGEPPDRDLNAEFCRRSILSGAKAGVIFKPINGKQLDIPISYGYSSGLLRRFMPVDIDAPYPACKAYRERQGVWLSTPNLAVSEYPDLTTLWRENNSYAFAALPLVANSDVVGVAGWSFRTPRVFTTDERAAFEQIAAYMSQQMSLLDGRSAPVPVSL